MKEYKIYLDRGWKVFPEPEGAETPEIFARIPEGRELRDTDIPATAADLAPESKTPFWFYRSFRFEGTGSGERAFLCFDQVICLCEAYVNGVFAGRHIHSEEKFEFDVTELLKPGGNLIALRVYGPVTGKTGPCGISMETVPSFAQIYSYYTVIPKTGIYGHVSLEMRPALFIRDVYVRADPEKKSIRVETCLRNAAPDAAEAEVTLEVSYRGSSLFRSSRKIRADGNGEAEDMREHVLGTVFPWTPDDPCLYDVTVTAESESGVHTLHERFGFKDFRVKDGYFTLNGKRIFLTSAHTEYTKEAVVHAKTMGFRMLRYLTAMPSEEILDLCDEIGMLVYEEPATSWGMHDYPEMPEHMASYISNMIRRDRNHVSVAIWGLFNEQAGPNAACRDPKLGDTTEVFDFAVSYLPEIRKLDDTRLVLLSSGRWDARMDIGSYSNPGSAEWEYGWGDEAPGAGKASPTNADLSPYMYGMGDNHLYPTVPFSRETVGFIRHIGNPERPVFLSEYGVGCQYEIHDLYHQLKKTADPGHPSLPYYAVQIERLGEFIEKYGLGDLYPEPRGFLMASIKEEAGQRRASIDPLRANPGICGYSMTSFSTSNEGVYYAAGRIMPGVTDALRDSFAPLKWSIFLGNTDLYADVPSEIEIVLCSEDVLDPGEYAGRAAVTGRDGVVFRKDFRFRYPGGRPYPPLAAEAARFTLPRLPAGEYTLSVYLEENEQPTCGEKTFRIHDRPRGNGEKVFCLGVTESFRSDLEALGLQTAAEVREADAVLVGGEAEDRAALLKESLALAEKGCRVVMLDDGLFEEANTSAQGFMGKAEIGGDKAPFFGKRFYYRNWLYHLDSYFSREAKAAGMADPGLVDMDVFRNVYPSHYFADTEKPEKTFCAAFGSGLFAEDHCLTGLVAGSFAYGKGKVTLNTFRLIGNLTKDPAADRIFLGLVRAASMACDGSGESGHLTRIR